MNKYDKILIDWVTKNSEVIYKHLETKINPKHNWRNKDIIEIISSTSGMPSEWEFEPYLEELYHVLNDYSEDFGIGLPKELIAYRLSKWANNSVSISNPLVIDANHWRNIAADMEFGSSDYPEEVIKFVTMLHDIAKDEALSNLPSIENVIEYEKSLDIKGKVYIIINDEDLIYLIVGDDNISAMDEHENIVTLDYNGNRLDSNNDKVMNFIAQGLKFAKTIAEKGELASLVGNDISDMLLGTDGLSVFDLPK